MLTLQDLISMVDSYEESTPDEKRDCASAIGRAILEDAVENIGVSRSIVKGYLDALDFYDGTANGARRRAWRARPYLSAGIIGRIKNAALEDKASRAGL